MSAKKRDAGRDNASRIAFSMCAAPHSSAEISLFERTFQNVCEPPTRVFEKLSDACMRHFQSDPAARANARRAGQGGRNGLPVGHSRF
jgi:hypothetical protein